MERGGGGSGRRERDREVPGETLAEKMGVEFNCCSCVWRMSLYDLQRSFTLNHRRNENMLTKVSSRFAG